MNALGFQELKVVALAADDVARAMDFYGRKLELAPVELGGVVQGYALGNQILMLKAAGECWPGKPGPELNPRLTIAVDDAPRTERLLKERGVTISDPVALYEEGKFLIGAFLDSEGNKLWFCSPVAA